MVACGMADNRGNRKIGNLTILQLSFIGSQLIYQSHQPFSFDGFTIYLAYFGGEMELFNYINALSTFRNFFD